jgi:pimeloyl-ACP methyl ester carboxylesterase
MIDSDGDENYQPKVIPIDGGLPEESFGGHFASYRCHLLHCDRERNVLYLNAESRENAMQEAYEANLQTGEFRKLAESQWGAYPVATTEDGSRVVVADGYTFGDNVLFLWREDAEGLEKIFGTTIEEQPDRSQVTANGLNAGEFTQSERGLLVSTALFDDAYSLAYLDLAHPGELQPVTLEGIQHSGSGEMEGLSHLDGDRFTVAYNIDGVSWLYEGTFDEDARTFRLERVIVGRGDLGNGTLEHADYDKRSDSFALSFSTAITPTQLFVLGPDRVPRQVTRERILGLPTDSLSPGEDASFTSFDGLRISARLYLPAENAGFATPYPLVYYIHGGPQGQERPNFAWFSMPLIQFLTLNGFAVFVPNVRGSTGYGQRYMKYVDKDWGGDDRLDHIHAMTRVLPQDSRVDVSRTGVMGRSYGGYMTLTLAARHPELWKGAIDMFGPYNLLSFVDRIPETWKPYFKIVLGDPETDRDFLLERSPYTYMDAIECPLFVIQGKNDPRVVEQESRDVVESLRSAGKNVEYLVFENEGHDVIKYENKVRCYTAINDFFRENL